MRGFELARPASLADAVALLDTGDPTVRAFSGGTALMLMMKTGVFQPSSLVHLGGIESRFGTIEADAQGGLRIGAMASLSQVEHSPAVLAAAPLIPRAMKRLSNVRVRNVARVGGNLAHGDPHMDLPPVLASLGARVRVTGARGERDILVENLFAGYYETVLAPNELITEVTVPSQRGWSSAYHKVTTRSADDWPALGIAVSLRLAGGVIAESRVLVSAATEKLTRLIATEAVLARAEPSPALFEQAGDAAAAEAEIIDDARGSAAYKTELLRIYVGRALEDAIQCGAVQ
jgi:carbon-monoxide dehydrogenase medium subunit